MSGIQGQLTPETPPPVIPPADQLTPPTPTPEVKPELVKPPEPAPKVEPLTAASFKLPDGVTVEEPLMTEFVSVMNNDKMTPAERGQALVDLQVKAMNAVGESHNKLWETTQAKWTEEAKADPVIGGSKLDATLGNVAKLIDQYSTDEKGQPSAAFGKELREVFDLTGAGNHPRVIRFLNNIATQLVAEGKLISGLPSPSPASAADIIYNTAGKA